MNSTNLTINTEAAAQSVQNIQEIVTRMENNIKTLYDVINNTIPERIRTTWSDKISSDWETYYKNDIAQGIDNMRMSGESLQSAVNEVLRYSNDM